MSWKRPENLVSWKHETRLGVAAVLAVCALTGCTVPVVRTGHVPDQFALPPAAQGALFDWTARLNLPPNPGESAFWLVDRSEFALNSRLAMFDTAATTLDIQYFIWQNDVSGALLMSRLLAAADRGVIVRLLVDDVQAFKSDAIFSAVATHPNIRIRLFNPWHSRSRVLRGFEFVSHMNRLNHRLHNKTIIADGHVGLIGGRNIGDRYFGIYDVFVQNDLDILFAGPILEHVIADFDLYWNAAAAVPVADHVRAARQSRTLEEVRSELTRELEIHAARVVSFDVATADWVQWWDELATRMSVGTAVYMADSPKIDQGGSRELAPELLDLLARADHEVVISTAYFIADDHIMSVFEQLADRGVRVALVTNSIQSNNHMLAHVGYRAWRERLLRAGIEVYELHPNPALMQEYAVPPVDPGFMGLHSKAAVVDGRWAFVGTPNLDPRSLELNTESGIVVDSPELASTLEVLIREGTHPENAWRVSLDERGRTQWTDIDGTRRSEPVRGIIQRVVQFLYRLMPIKRQA